MRDLDDRFIEMIAAAKGVLADADRAGPRVVVSAHGMRLPRPDLGERTIPWARRLIGWVRAMRCAPCLRAFEARTDVRRGEALNDTTRDVARALGIPLSTAHRHLRRALDDLAMRWPEFEAELALDGMGQIT